MIGQPKYAQIRDVLRAEIKREGSAYDVPSEYEAMLRFDVARETVRRAFRELQDEGLIEIVPGRGRRVVER